MLTVLFLGFAMSPYVLGLNITNGTEKAVVVDPQFKILNFQEIQENFEPCKSHECELKKLSNKINQMTKLSHKLNKENKQLHKIVKRLEEETKHSEGKCEAELKKCHKDLKHCHELNLKAGHKQFHFNKKMATWEEAVKACKEVGQRLASVHSKKEWEAVQKVIPKNTKVWMAGVKEPKAKKFHWKEGNKKVPMSFTEKIHETASDSKELCLAVDEHKWYGELCTVKYKFVCEKA